MISITTARGERAIAAEESPYIAIADDAHQERRHRVDVGDSEKRLTIDQARGGTGVGWRIVQRRVAQEDSLAGICLRRQVR